MNTMHLLSSGGIGGIEVLCREYGKFSKHNNIFVFLLGKERKICDQMIEQGSIVYEINCSKCNVHKTYKLLSKLCEKYNIDVIVEHHSSPVLYLYILALKLKYKNLHDILYIHSNAASILCEKKGRSYFRNIILKYGLVHADGIVAISQSVKDSLIHYFHLNKNKINIIYNGINLNNYWPIELQKKKNFLQLIYVGRLIKEKGVQVTLDKLSSLPPSINFKFLIVGDGVYRKKMEDYTRKKKLGNKVFFLGSRNDVPELLRESDIFIHMPEWEEGFGITIIEAMATGLICICNNQGAIPEIITNGSNGILIDYNNEQELVKLIEDIYYNRIDLDLNKIRKNAIISTKRFSIENYANNLDRLISLYNTAE